MECYPNRVSCWSRLAISATEIVSESGTTCRSFGRDAFCVADAFARPVDPVPGTSASQRSLPRRSEAVEGVGAVLPADVEGGMVRGRVRGSGWEPLTLLRRLLSLTTPPLGASGAHRQSPTSNPRSGLWLCGTAPATLWMASTWTHKQVRFPSLAPPSLFTSLAAALPCHLERPRPAVIWKRWFELCWSYAMWACGGIRVVARSPAMLSPLTASCLIYWMQQLCKLIRLLQKSP